MRSFREDGTGLVVIDIGSCNLPKPDFPGTIEDPSGLIVKSANRLNHRAEHALQDDGGVFSRVL
jgi:hypothetical protein